MPSETLTIVDNRTGREYSLPIVDGAIRATDLAQISAAEGDGGLLSYDPAYLNTSSCRSAITYIDGDVGILRYRGYPIEQVAEQASFLEAAYLLLEGELPTPRPARRVGGRRPQPHVRAHERHEVPRGLPLRRASDGHAARRGRRALDVLPGREGHRRSREPLPPARAADRQDPDDRGLRLPPLARPAVRLPAQRARLHRQLRQHDVRDRRAPRAEPGAAARARDPADPARRPRAELLDERGAQRRARRRSIRSRPSRPASRRSTARCTAARTRPCCACSTRSATSRTSPPTSRA